jgi:hypothetical protein
MPPPLYCIVDGVHPHEKSFIMMSPVRFHNDEPGSLDLRLYLVRSCIRTFVRVRVRKGRWRKIRRKIGGSCTLLKYVPTVYCICFYLWQNLLPFTNESKKDEGWKDEVCYVFSSTQATDILGSVLQHPSHITQQSYYS